MADNTVSGGPAFLASEWERPSRIGKPGAAASSGRRFSTQVQFFRQFGFLETFSFLGEGVGAAVFVVAIAAGELWVAAIGPALVALAMGALLAHLGRPRNSWRGLGNFRSAWASRGPLIFAAFVASSAATIGMARAGLDGRHRTVVTAITCVLAVPTLLYSGLLLRSIRAIRLWRNPCLALAFAAHSFASALVVLYALSRAGLAAAPPSATLGAWLLAMGALCVALSVAHLLLTERTVSTRASLDRLLHGDLHTRYVLGALVGGVAIPLVVLTLDFGWHAMLGQTTTLALLMLAGSARLAGDYAYRRAITLAGAYDPIIN